MTFNPAINALLTRKLPAVPRIVIERSLTRDIDELMAEILPGMRLAIVDDKYTSEAYGDHVWRALKSSGRATHIMLEGIPVADDAAVELLRRKTASADALIAVGSGTINDLCKYVSALDKKPYVAIPTAASMNGYCSANASITLGGYKKTMPAHMPIAVLCDVGVISAAPVRLTKAGLGDSLARPTAQADWLLSHLLLGTTYDETPFDLIMPYEPELFDRARGLALSDPASVELLLRVLLLSGLGMTIASGSYPASQAEHMIAHTYEMLLHHLPIEEKGKFHPLHGEQIGVTALEMATRQENILRKQTAPTLTLPLKCGEDIEALFGPHVASEAKKAYAIKQQLIIPIQAGIQSNLWEKIAEKIFTAYIPPARIRAILEAAKAPTAIEALGWDHNDYQTATKNARFLRERFTFLDLQ